VPNVDNMKTSLSAGEPLNGAPKPGPDLLEIHVFEVRKTVRAKDCCHARRLETGGRTFTNFLKLFVPFLFELP
jgi:hypothetical protein